MNAILIVSVAGLALVLLLRPWRWRDEDSRAVSALIAAGLSGLVLLILCQPL